MSWYAARPMRGSGRGARLQVTPMRQSCRVNLATTAQTCNRDLLSGGLCLLNLTPRGVTIGSAKGAIQALHERDRPAQDLTRRGFDPILDGVKLNAMIGPQV